MFLATAAPPAVADPILSNHLITTCIAGIVQMTKQTTRFVVVLSRWGKNNS